MAYGEYALNGRTMGKCLHRLSKIGIPLRIVESIIFSEVGDIMLYNKLFATFKWNEKDIPVFKFHGEHESYNRLSQDKVYTVFKSLNNGLDYIESHCFTKMDDNQKQILNNLRLAAVPYYINNPNGVKVGLDLIPIPKEAITFTDKVSQLSNKFKK